MPSPIHGQPTPMLPLAPILMLSYPTPVHTITPLLTVSHACGTPYHLLTSHSPSPLLKKPSKHTYGHILSPPLTTKSLVHSMLFALVTAAHCIVNTISLSYVYNPLTSNSPVLFSIINYLFILVPSRLCWVAVSTAKS